MTDLTAAFQVAEIMVLHMMWEQVRVTAVRRQGDIATARVRALARPPTVRLPGATMAVW